MKLSRTLANIVGAAVSAWMTLFATGVLPNTRLIHWVSVGAAGALQFMINMGYNRTPSGNVLPESVKNLVDSGVHIGMQDSPATTKNQGV